MMQLRNYWEMIFLLLLISGLQQEAGAGNTMTIGTTTTGAKQIFTLQVKIANSDPFVAFQFDLPIPFGFSYLDSSAVFDSARINGHLMSSQVIPGNKLRIIGYSQNNFPFLNDTGTIVTFKFKSGSVPGTYPLTLVSPVIGDTNQVNILTGSTNGAVYLMAPDINLTATSLDYGRVPLTGSPTQSLAIQNTGNQLLVITSITFNSPYFEVLGSSSFTVNPGGSHTLTVRFNSVMKGQYSKVMTVSSNDPDEEVLPVALQVTAYAVNELHTGNLSVYSGRQGNLAFSINNMEPFTGFQFDLALPAQMSYLPGSAALSARKTNHVVSASVIGGTKLRVVAWSPNGQAFAGTNGEVLSLSFLVIGTGGFYPLNLSNVTIGDTLAANCLSDFYNGSLQIAAPDISCPASINFGDVSVMETGHQMILVNNTGNDTLKISQIIFTDSSFSLSTTLPQNILPGQSKSFQVDFHNDNKGLYSGIMKVCSNDPEPFENPLKIDLTAHAYAPNYMMIPPIACHNIDSIWIPVKVNNIEPFVGFQFDMTYPPYLTYIPNSVQVGPRAQDHIVSAATQSSTKVRVIGYSPQQYTFTGDTGVIVKIRFAVHTTQTNQTSATIAFSNPILGDSSLQNILYGFTNGSVAIEHPKVLSGQFVYNNSINTPLDSMWVIMSQNGTKIDSVRTTMTGYYSFQNVYNGTYNVNGRTTKPFGGINGTDALKILLHFVGNSPLTIPIRITAADVNNSNTINSTDALGVLRRFIGLDTSFAREDWIFDKQIGGSTITINGNSDIVNFYGLCTGDVNGSYMPPSGTKSNDLLKISYDRIMKANPGQELFLPVFASYEGDVGAFSMVLEFPSNMLEILDVMVRNKSILNLVKNNQVRFAWADLNPLSLKRDDPLVFLKIKTSKSFSPGDEIYLINPSVYTEIADRYGTPLENIVISIPLITYLAENSPTEMSLFPNPAWHYAYIVTTFLEEGLFSCQLYSPTGNLIWEYSKDIPSHGICKTDIDVSKYEDGVYILKSNFSGRNYTRERTDKLVIIKK